MHEIANKKHKNR